jgi:GTP-binding protein
MSRLPKLAIVGRPNVGKSALFNRISGKKIAIVDEAEGITRDRLYTNAEFFGFPFTLIDTGGIDPRSKAPFNEEVKRQAEIAIEEADTIVLVVDGRIGLTTLDSEIAHILKRTVKPLCLAVNKIDTLDQEHLLHQFHQLGIKKMIGVSATQGLHIAELLESAFEDFPEQEICVEDPTTRVAIIGRPNVGKSTLVNYLLGDDRCIVSPIAGTTRDSVDVQLEWEGKPYTLIDTAGIRRKHAEHEVVDKFAFMRTTRAIERADVCVLILDASKGMTTQEKRIANTIAEAGKGCVLLLNKWDLVKGFRMEHCMQGIQQDVPFLAHCPVLFASAKTGRNIDKLLDLVEQVHQAGKVQVPTPQLNKFVESSMQKIHPPMLQGKRLRIYYMVQVSNTPPTFLLFVNYAGLMVESYKKYLYNQFREQFGFLGNPVIFNLKSKRKDKVDVETRLADKAARAQFKNNQHSDDAYTDEEYDDDFIEDEG